MNRKSNPTNPPSYPLTPDIYATVLRHWQKQIASGRVKLGRIEAMYELIRAGEKALSDESPTLSAKTKTRRTSNHVDAAAR